MGRRMASAIGGVVWLAASACGAQRSAGDRPKPPDVEVRMHNGRPTVFIDGKPNAFTAYCNFGLSRFGKIDMKAAMQFFLQIGMDAYYVQVASLPRDYHGTRFWAGDKIASTPLVETPGSFYDMDKQAQFILKSRPDAYIIVDFCTRPPASWKKKHADEYFVTEEGTVHDTPSLASDRFWNAASEFSAAIVRHVESRPWGHRVINYTNWHHTEGCHMPVADGWLFDHSALMTQRYRQFLRKKYGTVKSLRAAYADKTLSFDSIQVPKDKLRGAVPDVTQIPYWQTGSDNRALQDCLELTRDLFHQRFRQLAAAMQGATRRKVLLTYDALKQTMLGWNLKGFFGYPSFGEKVSWSPAYPEFMAGSGSMNVASLAGSPGFHGLNTPYDYQARGLGGVYEPEGIADSIVLRGMHFSSQMDSRFRKDYGIGAARTVREAAVLTWRNYATSLARGFSSYICWGFHVEDWFYCEPIKKLMQRQVDVVKQSLDWPHETMPGIAMILDDSAVLDTNGSGNYLNEAIMWEQKMGMARCGVPHRIYLFEDLALENFPKHRVFYFPNLFRVSDQRLELLKRKVFRDGHIVVWGPGSGISDGEKIGPKSATRLTGFKFAMLPANAPRRILISNFDHPITRDLDAATVIGGPLPYGPILLPTDGTELGVAWIKGGMNHTGLSIKEFGKGAARATGGIAPRGPGDYAAVFSTAVNLPADLWRSMARYAGAHVYCETNDVLMADSSVVAIHSLKPGKKLLSLPGVFTVHDLIDGRRFADKTKQIAFSTEGPDTRLFLLRSADAAANERKP